MLRLNVLKALTELLQGITAANDYPAQFDLSESVFRGRNILGDDDPKIAVTIMESPRPGVGTFVGENQARSSDWDLLLMGCCPSQGENPTDLAYEFLAQVEDRLGRVTRERNVDGKAEFPEHHMLGLRDQGVAGFQFGPGVVRPAGETSNKAFFYLPVRVELAERTG